MSETSPRLFIVSPHFDDAVFSCGALLAAHPDAAVCTVFAAPPEQPMHTEWDEKSGFADAHQAIHERTLEDNRALEVLDAIPLRMPFRDSQYLDSPSISKMAAALEETIYRTTANTLLMPLGLYHDDHVRVFEACCEILPRLSHLTWFGYEEAIHRRTPGVVQARLADLAQRGIVATPASPSAGHTIDAQRRAQLKREAVNAYQSQLRAFGAGNYDDIFATERYWQLSVGRRVKK
ncbi:PIG-L deacetylase family protein [Paraburkholderia aromaticivorans]|uniref:PIG-L deacetylase family protein n=1 Tax=Paraburkholderia aromaticivorans TaxID=2026199 RepID=UPI0014560988|nr:PIG-L family deacetylase [Paraburkholderia aromaticivorans]